MTMNVTKWINEWNRSNDVFEKPIADGTTNESNLASHYSYSPERWRVFKGSAESGNRLFPEYNNVPEYNHCGDVHELIPAAGETIILESAERYRYVVQYELRASFALQLSQELNDGDRVRVGFFDGSDGWFLEHNGGHEPFEVDAVALRDGSEIYREEGELDREMVYKSMVGLETAWYDISRQRWRQSFAKENGQQSNEKIGQFAAEKENNGPRTGNLNLRFEVTASATTNDLKLFAGSAALITLGSGDDNFRTKSALWTDDVNTTGTWVPIRAFREIPDKGVINNQILSMNVLAGPDASIEMAVLAFDETNVSFDGTDEWSTPGIWNRTNNAIETRSDVSQIVDNNGDPASTADNPGGFQVQYAALIPTTGAQFQKGASEAQLGAKRNLPNGDIGVVVAKMGSTGTLDYVVNFEEDW